MGRRLIDKIRESAGSLEINDPDDPSSISGFLNIGEDRLLILKEQSVFEILMADNIDPERTNPEIPNIYKKILNFGTNEESIWRILLMMDQLCKENLLGAHVDGGFVLHESLSLQENLCTMMSSIRDLENDQAKLISSIENSQVQTSTGFGLPQIENLEGKVKQFYHNAWKCFKNLFRIFSHAFQLKRPVALTEARQHVASRYGESDSFVVFLDEMKETFEFFRTLRNSIEHPKDNERVDAENFKISSGGEILKPRVKFTYREKVFGPADVITSLVSSYEAIIEICECFLAFTISYQKDGGRANMRLLHYPNGRDGTRRYRYGWGIELDGQVLPLG